MDLVDLDELGDIIIARSKINPARDVPTDNKFRDGTAFERPSWWRLALRNLMRRFR